MKLTSKNLKILFAMQMALMIALSFASGYHIPSYEDSNWDTTLFLTPIGILKNHLAESSALRSFYSDKASGNAQLTGLHLAMIAALDLAIVVCGLFVLRSFAARTRAKIGSAS